MNDKLLHFTICFALTVILSVIFGGEKAIAIVLILSIAKEIIDGLWLNGFSIGDLIADVLGIGFGILIFAI